MTQPERVHGARVAALKLSRLVLYCTAANLIVVSTAAAQAIRGRVVDERTSNAIEGARLTITPSRGLPVQAISDVNGVFFITLSASGRQQISVQMLGYAPLDSVVIDVKAAELVTVTLNLSVAAIPLQPLTVVARSVEPWHDATWEGFLLRRERLPPIGDRRAIRWDDLEMQAAMSVDDVLKWIEPTHRRTGCRVFLINGIRRSPVELHDVLTWSVQLIDGIEFYARISDVPQEYAAQSEGCGVIALWTRKRR